MKVVSERLGHAHIAHTLQTYQHVLPGMQADAANTAERLTKPQPTKRASSAKKQAKTNTGDRRGTTGGRPPNPGERPANDEGPGR